MKIKQIFLSVFILFSLVSCKDTVVKTQGEILGEQIQSKYPYAKSCDIILLSSLGTTVLESGTTFSINGEFLLTNGGNNYYNLNRVIRFNISPNSAALEIYIN
jgi:hypothetical protein